MKKNILLTISILMINAVSTFVYGYGNVNTHPTINKLIVDEFIRKLPKYKTNYSTFNKFNKYYVSLKTSTYKGVNVTQGGWFDINERIENYTAAEWIERGGFTADEPEIAASLRHFYDPVQIEDVLYLTDTGGNPKSNNPCIDAISWAFEGVDPKGNNNWTWNQGKANMVLALQTADKAKKEEYTAKAYRCLGEVLHNTADMGLPAHVRNDAHGGFGPIGGRTDPYEATTTTRFDWVAEYGVNSCDPNLAEYFRSATKARNINMYLANFTNKYFFSHETISGTGVTEYSSINGYKNYPSPRLQDFEYKPESFGYYKTFPSGREVKMCVDRSLFLGYISGDYRSQPRVDISCVESQATELLPDIIEAGINVVRSFIPELQIVLTANGTTAEVSGGVKHITDIEYPNTIAYSGEIFFWINSKLSNTIFTVVDGRFSGIIPGLKVGDKVVAKIDFADISVSSDEQTAQKTQTQTASLGAISLKLLPDATTTGEIKVQHFTDKMIITRTLGTYIHTAEINWLTPPAGNLVVTNEKQVLMNQKITMKLTATRTTGGNTSFNGCNLTVGGGGWYNDWQQSNEIVLGFLCPNFEKYIPGNSAINTISITFDIPVTISLTDTGGPESNTVDGKLIFNGSISDFWTSGQNVGFSIDYTYKD